jgi:hypothetical protein
MALSNLIDIEFTSGELKDIDAHLTGLETIFKNKVVQLTAKESQRYGKLGNETENWANMICTDTETATDLVPAFVDTAGLKRTKQPGGSLVAGLPGWKTWPNRLPTPTGHLVSIFTRPA